VETVIHERRSMLTVPQCGNLRHCGAMAMTIVLGAFVRGIARRGAISAR
jgi:hypothetical protein